MKKRVNIVIGTRPGIVKMAPVFKAVQAHPKLEASIVYTGQHYSAALKDVIWETFSLPQPDFVISGIEETSTHATQIAKMMVGCEEIFSQNAIETVLVCGDANTNLAAGLAARKLNLKLGHVESGLRSHDWSMPEEHNRVMLDHISDYLFAPTEESAKILRSENVMGKTFVTGNTVVDALRYTEEHELLEQPDLGVPLDRFALFTVHRQENVDEKDNLINLLKVLDLTSEHLRVVFPVHPRTRKMMKKFNLESKLALNNRVVLCEPLPYRQALWMIKNAKVVLTDSGGLQEESCIFGTPCVTLRENTERPESVAVGANMVAGTNPDMVLRAFNEQLGLADRQNYIWDNPFGDGLAAKRVADAVSV